MLNYKILDYKAKVTRNNQTYYDLMSKSYYHGKNIDGGILVVNKYYVARPDLISLAIYGSDQYADIICKLNGISNPFELNENDIIYYPNVEYLSECCKYQPNSSDFIKSEEDEIKSTKKILYQKKKTEPRSPNEQIEGQKNYIIDKSLGLVFY